MRRAWSKGLAGVPLRRVKIYKQRARVAKAWKPLVTDSHLTPRKVSPNQNLLKGIIWGWNNSNIKLQLIFFSYLWLLFILIQNLDYISQNSSLAGLVVKRCGNIILNSLKLLLLNCGVFVVFSIHCIGLLIIKPFEKHPLPSMFWSVFWLP